jgi:hypothetical protein
MKDKYGNWEAKQYEDLAFICSTFLVRRRAIELGGRQSKRVFVGDGIARVHVQPKEIWNGQDFVDLGPQREC